MKFYKKKDYEFLDEDDKFKPESVELLQKLVMERYRELKKWLKKTERPAQQKKIEWTLKNF